MSDEATVPVWQDGDLRVHADGRLFVLVSGQWLPEDEKTCVRLALALSKCDGALRAAVAAVEMLVNRLNAVKADNAALLAEMKEAHDNHESISGAVFDKTHPGSDLLKRMRAMEDVLAEIHDTPWQVMSLDQQMDINRKVQRLVGLGGA